VIDFTGSPIDRLGLGFVKGFGVPLIICFGDPSVPDILGCDVLVFEEEGDID
jgi:hypothetical protein